MRHPLACYSGQPSMPDADLIGSTCRQCRLWGNRQGRNRRGPVLSDGACDVWRDMFPRSGAPKVPHYAGACRYFKPNPSPPKVRDSEHNSQKLRY